MFDGGARAAWRGVGRSAKGHVMRLGELHEAGREDDVAAFEAATLKAREFEDWKDWNPKGRGNTKRM